MKSGILLNPVTQEDCRDIWRWRNHPEAKKNFFNEKFILWQQHQKWFSSKLKDANTKVYIAMVGKDKIGVIRFEVEKEFVKVSINLNPEFFGMGFGSKIIELGTEKFLNESTIAKSVVAEVKKNNIASQKAFIKAGYKLKAKMREKFIYKKDRAGVQIC